MSTVVNFENFISDLESVIQNCKEIKERNIYFFNFQNVYQY